MNSEADTEPRWLKYFDKLMELSFMFSVVLMIILFVLIIDIFMFADDDYFGADDPSREDWCKEYHSQLTYDECADVAGW